ncbi:DEAD/DEAH box helicase family protein [Falsiruegeria mediterranea]
MSDTQIIIPKDSPIRAQLEHAVSTRRMIFVAGLPGTGKSLMLQQIILLADQAGRRVHTMQWDAARRPFETPQWLEKYPEVDNLTHPGIRKAVGLWVRDGVMNWHARNSDPAELLVAELPVVGGRFTELLHQLDDEAEALLGSDHAVFFVPIPRAEIRRAIEGFRADTFANPRNEQETKDAPPEIVQNDWLDIRRVHDLWADTQSDQANAHVYDAEIYRHVYDRLMRHRNLQILDIDRTFETKGSAYERAVPVQELTASAEEIDQSYGKLQGLFPGDSVGPVVERWYDY